MAQQALRSSLSFLVSNPQALFRLFVLQTTLAATIAAQTPQQQYIYGSVPITTTTSQVAAYTKNGQTGALSTIANSPFADNQQGGAMTIDGLGHFLFVINPSTSNISMFQIDPASGGLMEVPGSPFSTGPTENLSMAPTSPVCLAAEKSGQFLYVGYRFGNFVNEGAINEYLIDAANRQLVPLPGQPTIDIASAPIGMIADPKGHHLYVGLGLNPSTGVQYAGTNVYPIDPVAGILEPPGMAGNAISAGQSIAIDPQGRFFFDGWGTTLGTIDSAAISPADGTAISGVSSVTLPNQVPVAMLVDSSGQFLYVQQGSTSVVYSINQTTGALAVPPTPLTTLNFKAGSAAADPLGPYVYSLQKDGVHGFLVDAHSGDLSEVAGSPFGGIAAQGGLAISGAPVQAASGPVAAIFPASEDFASITVGQSSSSRLVTLTNTGDQSLGLNSISITGTNPSDFIGTPNCSFPTVLSPNATCTVSVVFSPTAAGTRQASLAVADNAPGSPQSIPLSGTGVSPLPAVTLVPGSLTFASTMQGSNSPAQTITLTSSGNAPLHISSVMPGGANPADFQVTNGCSGGYPVGATCNIAVTFSPLAAGQRTADLTINDDAPNSPQSVQLTGTGAAPPPGTPTVKLAPGSLSFGTVTQGSTVAAQVITLTSSGTGPLHITSVALGGTNAADFNVTNNCTAPAYASGATCTVSVLLSPVATGARAAFISFTDDAPNSPQIVSLSVTVNPALVISPAAAGSTSVTVTAGQTATFNLLLTPGTGFTGNASFACAGAPAAATCTAASVPLGGTPVPYVVNVTTTASTMILSPPFAPRLPPFVWLRVFSLLAWFGVLTIFLRFRYTCSRWEVLRATSLAALICLCVFQSAGCGGATATVSPQTVPVAPHTIGTPQGTSTITVTPSVTTSAGAALPGTPPIQLTLTVQ